MTVSWIGSIGSIVVSSVAVIVAISCARPARPFDPMTDAGWCDTTAMKAIGRPVAVPESRALVEFGVVTGTVVQAETGDALQSAGVRLVSAPGGTGQSQTERATDAKGGFTFDSIMPGRYQIRIRRVGAYQDSLTIHAEAGRLDTVRLQMRAYRCYGY